MLKRVTKTSVQELLTGWSPELKEKIKVELSEEPLFMTVQRAASIFDVSESTIRRYIKRGDLVAIEAHGPNTAQAHANA